MNSLKTRIINHVENRYLNNELTNQDLVDICKALFCYLNPTPITEYAKKNKISRQAAYNYRPTCNFFGKFFVIDNN